ncbi:hypothetical protein D3C71_1781870 [compost metagenome]
MPFFCRHFSDTSLIAPTLPPWPLMTSILVRPWRASDANMSSRTATSVDWLSAMPPCEEPK